MSISAVIICNPKWYGSRAHLPKCLESVSWCDEIVLSVPSEPKWFVSLVSQYKQARIVKQTGDNFAAWRNGVMAEVKGTWVLFVDADEVVPEALRDEVVSVVQSDPVEVAFSIPRLNRIMGRFLRHGGWYPDFVLRLLRVDRFVKYHGELHEQPEIKGEIGYLHSPFFHYKHNDLEGMLGKTIQWSDVESKLLYDANHPPMNVRRFVRPFVTTFLSRYVMKRGFLDGTQGFIDAVYQSYSVSISYMKLWERQVGGSK